MHNYTVPSKYKYATRIGNWNEEWELEETRMKDYLKCKEQAQLQTSQKEKKMNVCLQKASVTYSKDGYVHFDDHILVYNEKIKGVLVNDIYDKLPGIDESYAVTTNQNIPAVGRSVFIIKRYEKDQELFQGNVLHYGQKFRIQVNDRIFSKQLFLSSEAASPQRCAKISRKQEVCVSNKSNINTIWMCEYADPKIRFEMVGQPIKSHEPLLIKHVLTSQWLATDVIEYKNMYGTEFEVIAHNFLWNNKTQNLIAEKEGRTTIDIPMRNQQEQNIWYILTADDPSMEFDETVLDKSDNVQDLIQKVKYMLVQKGPLGFRNLKKIFAEMDKDSSGTLDADDFRWGLRNYGLKFTEQECGILLNEFDKNKNGVVEFSEFISILRGQLSQQRQKMVEYAYNFVSEKLKGCVLIDSLVKLYDVPKHPDVVKGIKTEKQEFKDFVDAWNWTDPDKEITLESFIEFYTDLSAAVDKDEYFEAIIKNTWNLQ